MNNEMGAVEPVAEIGKLIKSIRPDIYFHVDAIQAYGKYVIRPKKEGIDLMSVSGHKIHGPKGVGFLYVDEKIRIKPIIFGGGQQGVEGVKYLSGVGGFCVLPVFILQLAATFKVFFIDKIIEEVEEDEITVQPEMMAELTEAEANA